MAYHDDLLNNARGQRQIPNYISLSITQAKARISDLDLSELDGEELMNLWIMPASRRLQQAFGINPLSFLSVPGSDKIVAGEVQLTAPTREQLARDFASATSIMIDKMAQNKDDVSGQDTIDGASRSFDHSIPIRCSALLEPYANRSDRIVRG